MSKPNDKAEESAKPKAKKPPGFRKFEKLLKRVVTVPPMKKREAT